MAAEPLSNGAAHQSVPGRYILPVHKRPSSSVNGNLAPPVLPVVDLGGDNDGRIAEEIVRAGREFGFFQVVNHGVPEEVMGAITAAAGAVARRVLRLAAVGLGLSEEHFEGSLSGGAMMNVNHYPPCPDPSLTLGVAAHCDPGLVTVLMENVGGGLQMLLHDDGDTGGGGTMWVDVDAAPGALVLNFGHQMEVVSNGRLRSGEHRVARTSLASFVWPELWCTVAPAQELVLAPSKGPLYRPYSYGEFLGAYVAEAGDRDAVMAHFKH